MADYTRLTNLEIKGKFKQSGLTKTTYAVTTADADAAASTAPTAAEFKKVVDLANDLKAKYNKLVNQICTGSDT